MKRTVLVFAAALLAASMLLAAAGCGGGSTGSTDQTTTTSAGPSGGLVTTSSDAGDLGAGATATTAGTASSDTTATSTGGTASSDQVFEPHQLLSAAEASAITTFAVTLEEGSLFKDEENGVISERYSYDLGGTGVHALVEIHQDGLKKSDGSVKDAFLFEKDLSKAEITPVQLGDDAFTHAEGQLHLLYGSYYIVVAFDADPYSTDLNAPLNIKLGTKILENLKAKLG
jgi:hypothetical protein